MREVSCESNGLVGWGWFDLVTVTVAVTEGSKFGGKVSGTWILGYLVR
jgi:hypothetical protein